MKPLFSKKFRLNLDLFVVLTLAILAVGFTIYQNLTLNHYRHFSLLARAFLEGRTDINEHPEMLLDTILGTDGKYHFFLDPLPGVLMIPLVLLFGSRASQGYLQIIINIINIYLINKLLNKYDWAKKVNIRWWFILIFFFASSMVSVIWSPHPWFLAQNIGVTWTLALITEWKGKRRPFLIFLLTLLLTLTKKNMAFIMGAFLLVETIVTGKNWQKNTIRLFFFSLAVVSGAFIIWNYQLVGNTKERLSHYYDFARIHPTELDKIHRYGIWNPAFIPTNFVNFFLAGPDIMRETLGDYHSFISKPYFWPSLSGSSLFLFAPIFFAIFLLPISEKKKIWPVLGAMVVWGAVYLTYHASGAAQFGARYTAELMPFLFLWLLEILPKHFGLRVRMVVVFSMLLNAFMAVNFFTQYLNP